MSSPWYLQFQSSTTEFILVFSLFVFVAPCFNSVESDFYSLMYSYYFMYLINFSVYGTSFPSPLLSHSLRGHPPHPIWSLTPMLAPATALVCTDASHSTRFRYPMKPTFLHRWPPYPAQTLKLCAGLPLSCTHGWCPHPAMALILCITALLAPLRLQNHTLGGATNPSSLVNALLTALGLQPTILDCSPSSPIPSHPPPTWACFPHLGKTPVPHSEPLKIPPPSRPLDWIVQERIGRRRGRRKYTGLLVCFKNQRIYSQDQ